MRSLNDLKNFCREAAAIAARDKEISAFEIYCSSAEHRVARLNYTSDIPSRGIEEFKSLNADGFAIRIVMARNQHETGQTSIASDLSTAAVRDALQRAHRSTIVDPHFPGLPEETSDVRPRRPRGAVPPGDLIRLKDSAHADAAWEIIAGAVRAFDSRAPLRLARPGLVVGGDLSLIRDRIAITNSKFGEVRADESSHFSTSVTVLVEALEAKGTATAIGSSSEELQRAAAAVGKEAVARALELRHGERPPAGTYRVVLGAQPVAEILNYMVVPSLTAHAFDAASTAYYGRFGAEVMDARLSLADDPHDGPVKRRITCEGLPALRTEMIRDGRLIGLLSTFYDRHRLLTDEHRAEKLGADAPTDLELIAGSAQRLGEGPARRFDAHPGSAGTNVRMRTRNGVDQRELLKTIGDGIYVGRVWYTYPINGQRAGDFTCTISGDSYLIRDGKIAAPLAPNCLRINANLNQIFSNPLAVGRKSEAAVVWGAPEAYFVPALAVADITLSAVGAAESD